MGENPVCKLHIETIILNLTMFDHYLTFLLFYHTEISVQKY